MPVRRGHVAPPNTFIDTIIRKFDGQSEYMAVFILFIPLCSNQHSERSMCVDVCSSCVFQRKPLQLVSPWIR